MQVEHKTDLEASVKLVLDAGLSTGHADTCEELMREVLSQMTDKVVVNKPPDGFRVSGVPYHVSKEDLNAGRQRRDLSK